VDRYFNRLKERVSKLGNHHQKYIRTIEEYLDPMVSSLEDAGKIEDIHLWRGSSRISQEMDIVLGIAHGLQEKLTFLACYYSLQMIHLNLRAIDVLKLNLTSAEDRYSIYKNFMLQTGAEFRKLTGSYMLKLLNLFFDAKTSPEFVMLGVGSLAHQDDIDVGVIDDDSLEREELNLVIGKIRNEMFKYATELHFYLSEHVGSQFYTASIQEYKELLDVQIQDFVMISEMLNAVPIIGSQRLFDQFEQEIAYRYYYHSFRDNKFHEGYLRGILGEIRSLLLRQINEQKLNPKDDALRMISITILAAKTIFRIYRGNRWDVLDILARKDSARKQIYLDLENVLTFFEIFRHLYQLFLGLDEDIYLDDPDSVNHLQIIATTLGYEDVGAISAWDHLLIHYHEKVALAKSITARLIPDLTEHLKSVSIFSNKLKSAWYPEPYRSYPGNLAVDFLRDSNFFKGAKFWDDILEALQPEDSHVLENLVKDFRLLKPRFQKILMDKYGKAARNAVYAMISFLIILWKNRRNLAVEDLCEQLNQAFLKNLADSHDRALRLTKMFNQYPHVINEYLSTLDGSLQRQFMNLLDVELWEPEQQKSKKLLMKLCDIHCNTSHYFKRFFLRVVSQYPAYIQYLHETSKLAQVSKGILSNIVSLDTFEEKKKRLGDYHDLEFLRVGLEALQGMSIEKIDADFTEFSDSYLQILFDICKQAVNEKIGGYKPTRDSIAIYTAGGYAREQAFDDDYDLIIFLNEKDEDIRKYCSQIITIMNTEIVKRGIMPHYRFADHFGDYITLVDDLDNFFSQDNEDAFIDKSQVLGARMIVGSTKFQKEFEERIIQRHIFDKYDQYKDQMIGEMKSRHKDKKVAENHNLNVKEGIGGLRDIEILLLIYKAKYRLNEPINRKLMKTICEINSNYHDDLCSLNEHFNFLKQLRDLYRLIVFAGNELQPEYLEPAARIMGYNDDQNGAATENLVRDYYKCTKETNQIVERLIAELVE
jgi:hypothetical protein